MEKDNIFKKIGLSPLEVPLDLKTKVLLDIENVKLLIDLTDLYSSKYNHTMRQIFKKVKQSNQP